MVQKKEYVYSTREGLDKDAKSDHWLHKDVMDDDDKRCRGCGELLEEDNPGITCDKCIVRKITY